MTSQVKPSYLAPCHTNPLIPSFAEISFAILNSSSHVFYYRKDLLQKYGYDVPKTWDELFNIAKDISAKEGINEQIP
ncbi:MAG TPA: extracellular solute-binding protein [Defluviitoga tunisiensis]|nr:extracellular solute-binding protein [Defluviitoga tunisiensis]